jgi:hypothetical protein
LQQNDRLRCGVFVPIRFIEPQQYAPTFDHAAFDRLLDGSMDDAIQEKCTSASG